jgi:hypothetical protein
MKPLKCTIKLKYYIIPHKSRGHAVAYRHYATSRKVVGSRPDEVDFLKFT